MRISIKTTSILAVFMFLLAGCGPSLSPDEKSATATAYIATSNAIKNFVFLTQTAAPTRPPLLTATPDTRSPFDKCARSGKDIRYVISGSNVDAVSLTFENDTGGTDQGDYKIPFCMTYYKFQSSDFLYISAQISSGSGSIKCQIYDGNTLIAEANANGFASIATCSGSAK